LRPSRRLSADRHRTARGGFRARGDASGRPGGGIGRGPAAWLFLGWTECAAGGLLDAPAGSLRAGLFADVDARRRVRLDAACRNRACADRGAYHPESVEWLGGSGEPGWPFTDT